ncbi:hypothetical protein E9993_00305 [Labilibacter sediminis]|nr:hypothetical protein E9993_00305 [Labilibacter sediminis]
MRFYTKYLIRRNKTRKDGSTPIYIRLSLNQKRVELSTGIFINIEDWDEVKQAINLQFYGFVVYNQQLQKRRTAPKYLLNRVLLVKLLKKNYHFLKIFSISSNDLPFVSGTIFHTNTAERILIIP